MAKRKQGEVDRITQASSEFKEEPVIQKSIGEIAAPSQIDSNDKDYDTSILTIKDGKPKRVFFKEGKYLREEDA